MTLDHYYLNDQPMTCPQCGTRTVMTEQCICRDIMMEGHTTMCEWGEQQSGVQLHKCPGCGFQFLASAEEEVELTDDDYEAAKSQMYDLIEQQEVNLILGLLTDEQIRQLAEDWREGQRISQEAS